MIFHILTLFPEMFDGPLSASILGRARESGRIDWDVRNIRDYTHDKHHVTDDTPYGGGAGMVMKVEPIVEAIETLQADLVPRRAHVVYLSPQGTVFNQRAAARLAREEHLVLLCGRYEGVDERALELVVDEEISIGDYVLTGGEIPAMVLVDAIARHLPDVVGRAESVRNDSFTDGLLDWPHYTRPEVFRGLAVPETLLGGAHARIEAWRLDQALQKTRRTRPDLYRRWLARADLVAETGQAQSTRRQKGWKKWIEVTARFQPHWSGASLDQLSARLGLTDSLGWSEEEDGAGRRTWKIYYPPNRPDAPDTVAELVAQVAGEQGLGPDGWAVESQTIPQEDWMAGFRRHFTPAVVSRRFAVTPPGLAGEWPFPDHEPITIYPAMAFGTGLHPTTRLAIQALEANGCAGRTVLDAGTGSAILCVAAVLLGSARTVGCDVDDVALENARENLILNDMEEKIELICAGPDGVDPGPFDIIVANILYARLRPLLPALKERLRRRAGSRLILGGFLTTERADVEQDLREQEMDALDWGELDEWSGVTTGFPT